VAGDLDVLEGTFMIRRLPPYHANVQKRLTKSPKLYLRDSGLLHFLAGLRAPADLESWPRRGASFEALVIEELAAWAAERFVRPGIFYWRTQAGAEVDLLIVEPTDLGYKAIINGKHWGLIHKNEVFKFLRGGMRERGYIRELRADGKISLSLQPLGSEATDALQALILQQLEENQGVLAVSDKSPAEEIARRFGVSKGNFKKAIGGLYKQGRIVIHPDRIERR